MSPDAAPSASPGGGNFPTTQWSMVLHAGAGADIQGRSAMESLCRRYWYPLYAFIRRQGRLHHEAEDCTQEFLARLLTSGAVARARQERGRFRSFLLAALRNFLTDEWRCAQAAKRGNGQVPLPLEFDTAEQRYFREPVDPALTPEQTFDRNWAQGMIDHAVAELRNEYEKNGRGALFAALEPLVWHNPGPHSHAELAQRLSMNTHAFTVALQRLRLRLSERLRIEVAHTVADPADVDTELRYIIRALDGPAS